MRPESRTRELAFERVGDYPQAPLEPLLRASREHILASVRPPPGVSPKVRATIFLRRLLFELSGLGRFVRALPGNAPEIERYFRQQDLRATAASILEQSYVAVLRDDPGHPDPLDRAATLLAAALDFRRDLLAGRLAVDRDGDRPLEMGQYPNLFATSVTPGDRIYKSPDGSHVVVLVGGRPYRFDVDQGGEPLSAGAIREGLREVVRLDSELVRNREGPLHPALGSLTCVPAALRGERFRALEAEPENRRTLETLASALLCVDLDLELRPETLDESARLAFSGNPDNRWFLCGNQLVVFGNSKAGVILTYRLHHDGNVGIRYCAEVQRRAAALVLPAGPSPPPPPVRRLSWRADRSLLAGVKEALQSVLRTESGVFRIEGMGSRAFKAGGVSPDAAFNLALMLAVRRLTGRIPIVNEFATMAAHRCSGVTIVVVTTAEAAAFVDRMAQGGPADERTKDLLRAASAAHLQVLERKRQSLSLNRLAPIYLRRTPRWRRLLARPLQGPLWRRHRGAGTDVIVSRTARAPEVLAVGRPGVRISYVRQVALHYWLSDDSIDVITMPGWSISDLELARVLEESLRSLAGLLAADGSESAHLLDKHGDGG